jgi:uncharacterized protein with PIN domain
MVSHAPPLLADRMLVRAARWLRLLGYDCAPASAGGPAGDSLVAEARRQGRLLLTCSRVLAGRHPDAVVFLPPADPLDQARRVAERFPLDPSAVFSRCSLCNVPLERPVFEEVAAALPPFVRDRRPAVRRCPACGRLYWEGTHTSRMRRVLAERLGPRIMPASPDRPDPS